MADIKKTVKSNKVKEDNIAIKDLPKMDSEDYWKNLPDVVIETLEFKPENLSSELVLLSDDNFTDEFYNDNDSDESSMEDTNISDALINDYVDDTLQDTKEEVNVEPVIIEDDVTIEDTPDYDFDDLDDTTTEETDVEEDTKETTDDILARLAGEPFNDEYTKEDVAKVIFEIIYGGWDYDRGYPGKEEDEAVSDPRRFFYNLYSFIEQNFDSLTELYADRIEEELSKIDKEVPEEAEIDLDIITSDLFKDKFNYDTKAVEEPVKEPVVSSEVEVIKKPASLVEDIESNYSEEDIERFKNNPKEFLNEFSKDSITITLLNYPVEDIYENEEKTVDVSTDIEISELIKILAFALNNDKFTAYPGYSKDIKASENKYYLYKYIYNNLNDLLQKYKHYIEQTYDDLFQELAFGQIFYKSESEDDSEYGEDHDDAEFSIKWDWNESLNEDVKSDSTETAEEFPSAPMTLDDLYESWGVDPEIDKWLDSEIYYYFDDFIRVEYNDNTYPVIVNEDFPIVVWELMEELFWTNGEWDNNKISNFIKKAFSTTSYPGKEQDEKETRDGYKYYYFIKYFLSKDNLENIIGNNKVVDKIVFNYIYDKAKEKAYEDFDPSDYEPEPEEDDDIRWGLR